MRPNRRHHRQAMTLVELIVSMLITSFIAMGVASIIYAAGYGTSSKRDLRRIAVRSEVIRMRLNNALRDAQAVLASGAGYIVLWTGDTNNNQQVNLSELQLIELPAGSTTLTSYTTVFPANWTTDQRNAADTVYAANANFATVAQSAKAGGYFPGTLWSENVSGLTFTLSPATPAQAKLVTWTLTLTDAVMSETLTGTNALRAHTAPQ